MLRFVVTKKRIASLKTKDTVLYVCTLIMPSLSPEKHPKTEQVSCAPSGKSRNTLKERAAFPAVPLSTCTSTRSPVGVNCPGSSSVM